MISTAWAANSPLNGSHGGGIALAVIIGAALTFLFLGVVLGCLNAWYWVSRESPHD